MAYKHVIRAKTKNLLNISDKTQTSNGVTLTISGNLITLNGTATAYTEIPCIITSVTTTDTCVLGFEYKGGDISNYTGVLSLYNHIYNKEIRYPSTFITEVVPTTATNALSVRFSKGVTFKNFSYYLQLELGSTPTPYTPYNYLQSNKRMIKVSDVCQLLDKSKFPATHTQLGCTFTNNGDGSFTINGTIQKGGSWSNPLQHFTQNLYGHKILLLTNFTSDIIRAEMKFTLQNGSSRWGTYNSIYTVIYDDYKYIAIRIYMDDVDAGKTIDNATVKFQLFDLTEMFGAGHEPTTVAEFRQRFPNEYYPYSPQCWLTSYKSAVVCKTKNLFDVNNAVPYTFYNDNPNSNLIWLKDGIYTTRLNNYNQGNGLRIKDGWSLPAGMYTLSVKVVDCSDFGTGGYANIGFYYKIADGTWHVLNRPRYSYAPGTTLSFAINIPEHIELRLYLNYQNMNGQLRAGYISYKDIQLEQGSTATSYVPYQHL